jgi:glucose-6-phosphate isomerase
MFAGELINSTEQRAVMHFLLRNPPKAQYIPSQLAINKIADTQAEVEATLSAMLAYAEQVRSDAAITDIVNIGIGGSDLGPQMAVLALAEFAMAGKRFHFVCNIDGDELAGVLQGLQPGGTLFLIASKTFTTAETMANAHSAKAWFEAQGGRDIGRHFAALTTHVAAANEFGITTTFGFWDWVGGRYSLWSAIGLPIAMAIGATGFREFLAGAHAMDEHFRSTALEHNLPVRLGLLDVWYRNFHGFASRSIAPYSRALRRWPAYLSNWRWRATASGWGATAGFCRSAPRRCCGASPAPMGSMLTSRCCTKARLSFRSNLWRSKKQRMRRMICPDTTASCWPMRWRKPRP